MFELHKFIILYSQNRLFNFVFDSKQIVYYSIFLNVLGKCVCSVSAFKVVMVLYFLICIICSRINRFSLTNLSMLISRFMEWWYLGQNFFIS